jgi:hypothetical protein
MTSNPPSILQRTQKWLIRKGNENRDAFILGRLQDEANNHYIPSKSDRPVLFFNASTRLEGMSLNSAFSILTSISLRWQGVKTIQWVCKRGMSHCVLGTDRTNLSNKPPCEKCVAQSKKTYKGASVVDFGYHPNLELAAKLDGMNFRELSDFELDGIPLGTMVIPSLRWILRKHHIEETKPNTDLLREYILSAENIARQIRLLLERIQPKAIVLFNGQFYPEAIVRQVATQKGIRVVTHEVGMQPMSAFFTEGEATAYPVKIPDEFELSSQQEKILDQYLQQRFQGDFSMAGIRFWPKMNGLDVDFVRRVKSFKQIVPVFTNVVFDTSQGHANVIFPDMFTWLDAVLALIKRHPETFFVIRAHPDEGRPGKESRESVADWVKKNHVDQLLNVRFVDFSEYFSSYELIGMSKFVMVYNSTIGLEASIMGTTVLCGGKARYTQYPTVILPKNAKEFIQKAKNLLETKTISSPVTYQQNARRFLYFQLFQTNLSFSSLLEPDPEWRGYVHLKKFPEEMLEPKANPVFKVLSNGILKGQPFLIEDNEATKEEKV